MLAGEHQINSDMLDVPDIKVKSYGDTRLVTMQESPLAGMRVENMSQGDSIMSQLTATFDNIAPTSSPKRVEPINFADYGSLKP